MNPFAALGTPPADDPKGQLEWLANALRALEQAKDPKLRPLKKRFARVVFLFQRSVDRGEDEASARARIQPEVEALLASVLRAIGRTLGQIASAVRMKHSRGSVDLGGTALIVELEAGARQFAAMAEALSRRDGDAMDAAQSQLRESSRRLSMVVPA